MQPQTIKIGNSELKNPDAEVKGKFITMFGETYYCIENHDKMPPFFMSIVSNSDHWMFISSTGGLTAGRRNAESAIFPYGTDDTITESYPHTGPITIFLVRRSGQTFLWEPFSSFQPSHYSIERKLYKNISGNKLIFQEKNIDLGLTYLRAWRNSERFGFILSSWLHNQTSSPAHIRLLTGVQNILPYGVTSQLQTTFSNLLNAYKRSELEEESGLGIFSLSSTLTDLAEPSESLKATTAFQIGLDNPIHLLSSLQLNNFRQGVEITQESDIRGYRGAYLLGSSFELRGNASTDWSIAMEVNQDSADIASLLNILKLPQEDLAAKIEADIAAGDEALNAIIASADGLQTTGDRLSSAHHYANVLFNTMRGGIFANNYQIDKTDLIQFLQVRNRIVLKRQKELVDSLPDKFSIFILHERARKSGDQDLVRLCSEYLPLTFSRRHGDPSRPWNVFSINLKNEDGTKRLDYQGNWRDVFQNWEALACSFPEFIESMISTFINAGTPDGYNPYRISRAGVEWEVPEPDNPWANIGYWSDHQIIYLQKLLELSLHYHPGKLQNLLNQPEFCYVNIPYRIRQYSDLLQDPYKTIDFDFDSHHKIADDVASIGNDGKLVRDNENKIIHVTLSEKLLVFLLAKLVNFIPEGGIWMNTQRPEWNDANNALVGKGISVVTLSYLRRYVEFWLRILKETESTHFEINQEVKTLFEQVDFVLTQYRSNLKTSFSDVERRAVMDALGQAGSDYRWNLYQNSFSRGTGTISITTLRAFLDVTLQFIEHTLKANRRADGLFHAYNILKLGDNSAQIGHLYEMLEGQVSILSSGFLTPEEALEVLQNLRQSSLYRKDQHSYILYPDRDLPPFLEKNLLPRDQAENISLVKALVEVQDTSLILQDENGDYHFNGSFRNTRDVLQTLDNLKQQAHFSKLVEEDGDKVLALFEKVFQHDTFTGRSGTFFAYEGLGSIYWHMVSKLLLAAQENYIMANDQKIDQEIIQELAKCYYDIRNGLGFNKPEHVYGAFPTDPYSHTPKGQGAKQPGMTGQVKEEILTRQVELGVTIQNGQISFHPDMLREKEFLSAPTSFEYFDLDNNPQQIELPAGSLAFTICQVPVTYQSAENNWIQIHHSDGSKVKTTGTQLSPETCKHIFGRDGKISRLDVYLAGA